MYSGVGSAVPLPTVPAQVHEVEELAAIEPVSVATTVPGPVSPGARYCSVSPVMDRVAPEVFGSR